MSSTIGNNRPNRPKSPLDERGAAHAAAVAAKDEAMSATPPPGGIGFKDEHRKTVAAACRYFPLTQPLVTPRTKANER